MLRAGEGHGTSTRPRLIRLRRPPTIIAIDEPFVPQARDLGEIDRAWSGLCARNPAFFDGRLLHVIGVHRNGSGGATVHVAECAYRHYAVIGQGIETGVRPLGVKAFTTRRGAYLMGRRSRRVDGYPGSWEFAPGGGLEPGVAPETMIERELGEETGLRPSSPPIALALLFDPVMRTWEVVHRVHVADDAATVASDEYDELRWMRREEVPGSFAPGELSPIARTMLSLLPERS